MKKDNKNLADDRSDLDWDDLYEIDVSNSPPLTEEEILRIKREHETLGIKDWYIIINQFG